MTKEACRQYLENPEEYASHLDECLECAALFGPLDLPSKACRLAVDSLPLASWEGASHRAWPLVVAGGLAVLSMAVALFAVAGIAPSRGIVGAIASLVPSFNALSLLLRLASNAVQHAPVAIQIGVALSFVAINTLLIVLLRRAPKGIDV